MLGPGDVLGAVGTTLLIFVVSGVGFTMPNWYEVYGLQANVPEQEGMWRVAPLPRFEGGGGRTGVGGGTGFGALRGKAATDAGVHLVTTAYLEPSQQIARYKAPRGVEFIMDMPRTETGKLLKREIRDQYLAKVGG